MTTAAGRAPQLAMSPSVIDSGSQFFQAVVACNGDVGAAYELLGINASLPQDVWERMRDIIIEESQKTLIAVNDIRARPALLETVSIHETVVTSTVESDLPRARQAIEPDLSPERVDQAYAEIGVPVPFIFMDSAQHMRTLAAPVPGGGNLRTRWVAISVQKVAEEHELNLFNGNPAIGVRDRRNVIHSLVGYTTFPANHATTQSAPWATFDVVSRDFNTYMDTLRDDFFDTDYMVYVGATISSILNANRSLNASERTWRQLLLDDPRLMDIKFVHDLGLDELVMVALQPNVVNWIQAADIQTTDWEIWPFSTNYRTWSIGAPHLISTYSGRSGILFASGISAA